MKISTNANIQTKHERKAASFASHVSKALRDEGLTVVYSDGTDKDGIRVTATDDSFSGLPTARVKFNYLGVTGQRFVDMRSSVSKTLRDKGYWIMASGYDSITIAPRHVNFVSVPSSEQGQPDYTVRLEAGIPMLCSCKGFTYRLTCRHLDEAVKS